METKSQSVPDQTAAKTRTEAEILRMERIWSIALTGSGAVGAVTGVFSLASAMLSLSHVDLTGGYDYLVCTVLTVFAFLLFACTAHSLDQIDQLNADLREVRSL